MDDAGEATRSPDEAQLLAQLVHMATTCAQAVPLLAGKVADDDVAALVRTLARLHDDTARVRGAIEADRAQLRHALHAVNNVVGSMGALAEVLRNEAREAGVQRALAPVIDDVHAYLETLQRVREALPPRDTP